MQARDYRSYLRCIRNLGSGPGVKKHTTTVGKYSSTLVPVNSVHGLALGNCKQPCSPLDSNRLAFLNFITGSGCITMRGRGRGTINESRGTRKPQNNRGAPRNSTWDRALAGTSTNPVPKSLSSTNRQIKPNDQSKLQLIPSVSRSSGLEPNGDA